MQDYFFFNLHTTNKPAWLWRTGLVDKYRPGTTQHGSVRTRIDCNNQRRLLMESVSCLRGIQLLQHVLNFFLPCFLFYLKKKKNPATDTLNGGDHSLGKLSQTHLCSLHFSWVLLHHREDAAAGTLKYPHEATLIHKVVLYVEVQASRSCRVDPNK